jgi:uncharacterized protein YndB with AHSA1/START domain
MHEGQLVQVVEATRVYDTGADDLWDALTSAERIPRWFLPIEGELRPGGRYQLEGNAGGMITHCDPPRALDLTWEFGGGSWVMVRLEPDGAGTRLTLEHLVARDDHWTRFGPGAVGVGWEFAFMGLGMHLASGGAAVDRDAVQIWVASPNGHAFIRSSADAWRTAHVASGASTDEAHAMAVRTAAAYTGTG